MLRRIAAWAGGWLLAGLLAGPAFAAPRIEVTVGVDHWPTGHLRVRMLVVEPGRVAWRLRGVPAYVDNPVPEARGEVVGDLRVRSGSGDRSALFAQGKRGEAMWTVDDADDTLEVSYSLRLDFRAGPTVERYAVHVPQAGSDALWLTGNLVFLTPAWSDDRVADLRRPVELRLHFDLPEGARLHGPPDPVRLRNLHELLSLQFGLGDFDTLEATGPGWTARWYLASPSEFSRDERVRLAQAMRRMAGQAVDLFGGAPFGRLGLYAFRHPGFGGLEGAFAGQAYLPRDVDLADPDDPRGELFFRVAMHELVHTWLPIALFALDDPWFKEGVTSHYGLVLSARAGWPATEAGGPAFTGYDPTGLEPVALSDPRLWHEEYSGESWRRVSYDRGHAVALMLDLFLREASDHRRGLDDVLRRLYREHRRGSFDRAALLAAIEASTGVSAAEFFARWVDSTTAPTLEEVERARRRAVELGIYAPGPAGG